MSRSPCLPLCVRALAPPVPGPAYPGCDTSTMPSVVSPRPRSPLHASGCVPSHHGSPLSMPPTVLPSPASLGQTPWPQPPDPWLGFPLHCASHFAPPLAVPIPAWAPHRCLSLPPVLTTIDWQDLAACAPILPITRSSPVTLQQVTPQLGQPWLFPAQGTHQGRPLKPMGGWQSPQPQASHL